MSINFNVYRETTTGFDLVDVPDQLEVSVSSANGRDLLHALGIEQTCSDDPWPIHCFRALITVARRKRLDHQSPEIPVTEHVTPGRCTFIDCGRPEGYIERRLCDLSHLLNHSVEAGATHIGWG